MMASNMTNAQLHGCALEGWECFHCGELFTTVGGARDHFGTTPDAIPGCLLKVQLGDERGWLMELRKLQDENAKLLRERAAEETEADKKIRSWHGHLQTAVREAEESGFDKAAAASADRIAELEAEAASYQQVVKDEYAKRDALEAEVGRLREDFLHKLERWGVLMGSNDHGLVGEEIWQEIQKLGGPWKELDDGEAK